MGEDYHYWVVRGFIILGCEMKAVEFVNRFGWFTAKEYLAGATIFDNHLMVFTDANDLKTLVEAKELVDLYGGLFDAKKCLLLAPYAVDLSGAVEELQEAIKLVESVENA